MACLLSVVGIIRFYEFSWWLLVPGVVVLYLLSFTVRRIISSMFLGLDDKSHEPQELIESDQSAKDKDGS